MMLPLPLKVGEGPFSIRSFLISSNFYHLEFFLEVYKSTYLCWLSIKFKLESKSKFALWSISINFSNLTSSLMTYSSILPEYMLHILSRIKSLCYLLLCFNIGMISPSFGNFFCCLFFDIIYNTTFFRMFYLRLF